MNRPKDVNASSPWNMRIWDDDNGEWLCQSDKDALTYYGFDITGGETTEFQGLPKWHPNRHLIWEQSTALRDKNGVEIYEGDVVSEHNGDIIGKIVRSISGEWRIEWMGVFGGSSVLYDETSMCEVIGTIHEPPKDFHPEHLKRMKVTISKGDANERA